jgi:hypothetical protein
MVSEYVVGRTRHGFKRPDVVPGETFLSTAVSLVLSLCDSLYEEEARYALDHHALDHRDP